MIVNSWLTINKRGKTRLSKNRPSLAVDEVSIRLNVDLPDALFTKPRLEASVTIPEEASTPELLSATVVENVREAVESVTGLKFAVTVVQETPEGK